MQHSIPWNCTACRRVTRHDILKRIDGTVNIILRISCSKCETLSFQIEYPKEIIEANIFENPSHYSIEDDPGDLTNFH